jgi:hypothetical protein
MSRIEELVYSAHEYGKRKVLLELVSEIRAKSPSTKLEDAYDSAYQQIMKT